MRDSPHLLTSAPPDAPTREVHAAIESVAGEWDDLADRVGAPPFLRPGWFTAWWAAFGRGSLEILVVRRGDRMAGVLPMARQRRSLASLSNWHTPAFGAVAEPGVEPDLARMLLDRRARRITLAFVDPGAPLIAASRDRWAVVRTVQHSPYLRPTGTWEAFEREHLSSNRRSELRRRWRRLVDQGAVALEVRGGGADLERLLDEAFEVEARSWKGGSGTAIASHAETRGFYADVARWAARRGELIIAFLRLEGRPLAFDLDLEAGGVHYGLKTGYDPEFRRCAPGLLLRADMVARAFGRDLSSVEFCGDAVPWKLEWTTTCRERVTVQAFASGIAGRLDGAAQAYARPLVKRLLARARQ